MSQAYRSPPATFLTKVLTRNTTKPATNWPLDTTSGTVTWYPFSACPSPVLLWPLSFLRYLLLEHKKQLQVNEGMNEGGRKDGETGTRNELLLSSPSPPQPLSEINQKKGTKDHHTLRNRATALSRASPSGRKSQGLFFLPFLLLSVVHIGGSRGAPGSSTMNSRSSGIKTSIDGPLQWGVTCAVKIEASRKERPTSYVIVETQSQTENN